MTSSEPLLDCLIVGGGPAGLTAAIYLARFHLSAMVYDDGKSRAGLIPLTRNHAGFPAGIAGEELLTRMREQAMTYGAELRQGAVDALARHEGAFEAAIGPERVLARSVLLATGVVNRRPAFLDDARHAEALAAGSLRYCPICDGFEVTDKSVAVLGTGDRGHAEAIFLRSYTRDVTLVSPAAEHALSAEQLRDLDEAGVRLSGQVKLARLDDKGIVLGLPDGERAFASLYPALGSDIRSELAGHVGAERTDDGCLTVDAHQRTNVPGLYAAGDVVLGLDQISHAMGQGGVAATTIRNDLARQTPLRR